MFSLSVCLIVKDEEKVISRVLNCVKEFADEIIVVDTGSSDNTIEIAKQFTNNIYTFKWINDFSKARNFSFSKATKDYIMWIDADDYITRENRNKILKLKQNKAETDVYMLKYVMGFTEENKPSFCFYRERIVKRSCNFKWQGFIHEVITPAGKIEYLDIEIEHRKLEVKDEKRNLRIYRNKIRENFLLNARETYYYARELYYNGYYSSCIKNMKKFLKMQNKFLPDIISAYIFIADCYMIKQNYSKALIVMLSCIKDFSPTPEVCCMIGAIYNELKKLELSVFWFKSALDCEELKQGFVRPEFKKLIPYLELTKNYYLLGDIERSYYYHKLSLQTEPNNESVKHNSLFFENYFRKRNIKK